MKLSTLIKTKTVNVPFDGGESLNVTYRQENFTPRMEKRLRDLQGNEEALAETVTLFTEIVSGWDLETDSQPIPITDEALFDVPIVVLTTVLTAIVEDINPNSTTSAGTSDAG